MHWNYISDLYIHLISGTVITFFMQDYGKIRILSCDELIWLWLSKRTNKGKVLFWFEVDFKIYLIKLS